MPKTKRKSTPAGRKKTGTASPRIHISNLHKRGRISPTKLSALAGRILQTEKKTGEMDIILADDKLLKSLNNRFAGKRKTTDVLSFPFTERLKDDSGRNYWGEIYISLNQAQRQAGSYGISLQAEVAKLVCHGTLHLLGYDHKRIKDASKMQAKERKYLNENQ
jgi:probable rRNA maturation factor